MNPVATINWDLKFLNLAKHIAQWSKDPSTKVGAVIVDNRRCVVSLGYNGFPRGVNDLEELYENRKEKHFRVVHAEANAILTANRFLEGCTLYCTLFTCNECAKLVIQTGIKRVVSFTPANKPHWEESFKVSREMYRQSEVRYDFYDE